MTDKPWCQIYDLDGTLAIRGDRGPYDWDRVGEDTVNEAVAHIAWNRNGEDHLIVVSGRSDVCEKDTCMWLYDNSLKPTLLLMRKHGDTRCDTIVKEEMYNEHIKDKYNVRFVVDDRPKVCRMWRRLGLPVLQVGDPHVEF